MRRCSMIAITKQLAIPDREVQFTASRSSGPGGQNVNKVNTRVTLHFPVWSSKSLTASQKAKIASCLKSRITKDGILHLHAQGTRSQAANRAVLIERFATLLAHALKPAKTRKATPVPHRVIEHRLHEKKQRAVLKKERRKPRCLED